MSNKLDIKLKLPTDAELERMFHMVPKLEKFKVTDQVVNAGTAVVVKRARALAPRSKPEDRKKRSKSQRDGLTKGGDRIDWDYPLWKTIKRVIRKYNSRYGVGIVGPEWPKGNKAYFNTSPKGNKGHLWGYAGKAYPRRDGKTHVAASPRARAQIRNWIVQAFDETRPAQLSAMKAKLTELMDKVMRG